MKSCIYGFCFVIAYITGGVWLETIFSEPAFFAFYGSIAMGLFFIGAFKLNGE